MSFFFGDDSQSSKKLQNLDKENPNKSFFQNNFFQSQNNSQQKYLFGSFNDNDQQQRQNLPQQNDDYFFQNFLFKNSYGNEGGFQQNSPPKDDKFFDDKLFQENDSQKFLNLFQNMRDNHMEGKNQNECNFQVDFFNNDQIIEDRKNDNKNNSMFNFERQIQQQPDGNNSRLSPFENSEAQFIDKNYERIRIPQGKENNFPQYSLESNEKNDFEIEESQFTTIQNYFTSDPTRPQSDLSKNKCEMMTFIESKKIEEQEKLFQISNLNQEELAQVDQPIITDKLDKNSESKQSDPQIKVPSNIQQLDFLMTKGIPNNVEINSIQAIQDLQISPSSEKEHLTELTPKSFPDSEKSSSEYQKGAINKNFTSFKNQLLVGSNQNDISFSNLEEINQQNIFQQKKKETENQIQINLPKPAFENLFKLDLPKPKNLIQLQENTITNSKQEFTQQVPSTPSFQITDEPKIQFDVRINENQRAIEDIQLPNLNPFKQACVKKIDFESFLSKNMSQESANTLIQRQIEHKIHTHIDFSSTQINIQTFNPPSVTLKPPQQPQPNSNLISIREQGVEQCEIIKQTMGQSSNNETQFGSNSNHSSGSSSIDSLDKLLNFSTKEKKCEINLLPEAIKLDDINFNNQLKFQHSSQLSRDSIEPKGCQIPLQNIPTNIIAPNLIQVPPVTDKSNLFQLNQPPQQIQEISGNKTQLISQKNNLLITDLNDQEKLQAVSQSIARGQNVDLYKNILNSIHKQIQLFRSKKKNSGKKNIYQTLFDQK